MEHSAGYWVCFLVMGGIIIWSAVEGALGMD